ncbi:MAG: addiction module antidote protein, HigA family [Deltaproteobacteria bacterium HGW-Deltaproteobacteria-6]|jgi:HTH-type transcriptional regulator/antitoxin HigA|nr:MAG: addiction module antidote protein, HigA family [Deltaproteobacteria bacterium HGW-Deltaproteobacteria-6]
MAERRAAEVFPPGEFIKEELETRNWNQTELAEIIGRLPSVINELISGKRAISPEIAKALGEAFGTSADYWLNLESMYQLWHVADTGNVISRRARLYKIAPIKEMVKRHWIEPSENIDVLENTVKGFFKIDDLDNPIQLPYAARCSRQEIPSASLNAWLVRAKQLAICVDAKPFSVKSFSNCLAQLKKLMPSLQEVRHVPRILAENGIRFLVLEHLPQTSVDGVTFWLDNKSPVIVLSLRSDRIDNFWYTLAHELGHVKRKDGLTDVIIDTNLVGNEYYLNDIQSEAEQQANLFAADFLINQSDLNNFIARVRPLYGTTKIIGFAQRIGVHPAIVIGQLQFKGEIPWSSFRKMLDKMRHVLIPSALTDGWGQTVTL